MKLKSLILTAAAVALVASPSAARDRIKIVGSSTVFPYAQAVAEEFAQTTRYQAPIIESTGSGGGMKIFCQGIGTEHPDITNASRAMKKSEYESCMSNGVDDITEVMIGYDGLSIAHSRKVEPVNMTEAQLFLALAAEVPQGGKLVPNPNKKWSDIDSSLPETEIRVFGPPPTSGTRDAFVELAMHDGCKSLQFYKEKKSSMDKNAFKKFVKENCSRMRTDGLFIEAGENDNLIVQRLVADKDAFGIFGYSFLFENQDTLQAVAVEGIKPNMDTIASGEYDIARPLFFYVKNAHRGVIPGVEEYVAEFLSDDAAGEGGYLSKRGLVVLPEDKLADMRDQALARKHMTRYQTQ